MKLQNIVVSSDPNGINESAKNNGELQHNNHQRAKELFPTNNDATGDATLNNNNNNGHTAEKPEIPPLPKQLLLQQQQLQQYPQQDNNATTTNANNISAPMQQSAVHPPLSAKPVPMTRTQFFGLDSLPSPVADRKSNDSVNSMTFKPDLPQKPKIPKRPMVLGLQTVTTNSTNRNSDDESAGTQPTPINSTATNGSFRGNKTAEQLVQEHCDNVSALQANIGSSNTSIPSAILKEANHNNHHNTTTANEVNANPNPAIFAPPPSVINKLSTFSYNPPSSINSSSHPSATNNTTSAVAATAGTFSANNDNNKAMTTAIDAPRLTPTTPVSPNMIMTPKRPTVPAPPPPVIVKKPVE